MVDIVKIFILGSIRDFVCIFKGHRFTYKHVNCHLHGVVGKLIIVMPTQDKWRNISVANGQNPREKSQTLKVKTIADAPATPLLLTQAPASTAPVVNDAPADARIDESEKHILDRKAAPKYNAMIYEALSTLNDPNGSDISSIVSSIKERHEVPHNFKRLLSGKLSRLVGQGKLEKVLNCYRIPGNILLEVKVEEPAPRPRNVVHEPRQSQTSGTYLCDTVADAVVAAACKVAEAENKSWIAAKAMKEAERVAEMAEDADSFLQLAEEIFERCCCGEIVMIV